VTTGGAGVWPKLLIGGIVQVIVCGALLLVTGASAIWFLVALAALLGCRRHAEPGEPERALLPGDGETVGASAGLLRTFMYLGAIISSSASAASSEARGHRRSARPRPLHARGVRVLVVLCSPTARCADRAQAAGGRGSGGLRDRRVRRTMLPC